MSQKFSDLFFLEGTNSYKFGKAENIFAAFAAAFCLAGTFTLFGSPNKNFTVLTSFSLLFTTTFILCILIFFAGLLFLSYLFKNKRVIPVTLFVSSVLYGSTLCFFNPDDIYFNIGVAFILFIIVAWICKGDKMGLGKICLPQKSIWIFAGIGALLFTLFVSVACIARYQSYTAHNFDFGIFTQMFENMRTTGMADTTVERNVLMSHFGVHFSPFYYILLPFYMIVPRPETLLVLQAAFVAAGVFAVVMICKKLQLSGNLTVAFCCIYLFFPSLANGCLYDFHENKFLTVLLLWTVYFMLSKNTLGLFIFSALTLTLKEDAAIYIAAVALYILFARKESAKGVLLLALSVLYFVFAATMVNVCNVLNEGIMVGRFENYIPAGGSGFLSVVQTCFLNFGYFISQVFTADKIAFVFWMLLPLAFAPLMGEKKSVFLLLLPMLAVDLMSNWQYQYDINYQYTFGVAALLIAMAIMAVTCMQSEKRRLVVVLSCALCVVFSFSLFFPRMQQKLTYENSVKETTQAYNELIATIPKDASVTANGYYIPHMYNFKTLYMYPNYYQSTPGKTDYMLVSESDVAADKNGLKTFMGTDYTMIDSAGNMQLYKKN